MEFFVPCACGCRIRVSSANAGTEMRCSCGQVHAIPSLSELRRRAGQPSYGEDVVGRIRALAAQGRLPEDHVCADCGLPTEDILDCVVECERPWSSTPGFWRTLTCVLFAPMFWWGSLLKDSQVSEAMGRELRVEAPLRLCTRCQSPFLKSPSPGRLHSLLQRNDLYRELLRQYPEAEVTISSR